MVVGWNIPGIGAYFEAFSLDEADSTLSSVRLSLVLASLITVGLGILVGTFAARRAVRPLATAAQAASAVAGGRLDTRMETTEDPDLRVLAAILSLWLDCMRRCSSASRKTPGSPPT